MPREDVESVFELLGILVLSKWWNIPIQASHIQSPACFCHFNIAQNSDSGASIVLALFKLLDPGAHILCSGFPKIPHVGHTRTFKVPTLSHGPPLWHNIGRCISLISTNQHGVEQSLATTKCGVTFAFWCVNYETMINGIYTSSNQDKVCS